MSQETVAAQVHDRSFRTQWRGEKTVSVTADTTYGNGEFLQSLLERDVTPYMRTREHPQNERSVLRPGAVYLSVGKHAVIGSGSLRE
jgi:hypothetical protein